MPTEIFKIIPNYEGMYEVSNLGNVKSFKGINERILKPNLSNSGYLAVVLSKKNKTKLIRIHQLVAMVFLNHIPCGHKLVVNHLDFNKKNNKLDNLEITTQRKNANRKHIKSTSKYVGVHWHKAMNKWCSSIVINKKQKNLGYFKREYDAHLAYQNELEELIIP
jgi:hypothetical protein